MLLSSRPSEGMDYRMYKYECTCNWSAVLLFITRGGRSPALAANAGSEKPRAEKEEKDE